MVNAIFDGMNLVAKEGALVNERDGVLILSENTGAFEELGAFAVPVNPFDIEEQAAAIHTALDDAGAEKRGARRGHPRRGRAATASRSGSRPSSPTSTRKRAADAAGTAGAAGAGRA